MPSYMMMVLCLPSLCVDCVCLPQRMLIDFVIIIFLKTEWRKVDYFCAASCVCEWDCACILCSYVSPVVCTGEWRRGAMQWLGH